MSVVAGIDPSLTSAGLAILRDGQPVHASHHGFSGHNGASYQSRSRRIRKQVADVTGPLIGRDRLAGCWPDLVVMEEHPYAVRISAGEFDRSGLWHGIFGAFDAREVRVVVINNSTAKRWITGRGDAKKPDIVAEVETWWPGWTKGCDDIADALGLAAIGAFHLGEPMPFEVKDRHATGLEKVRWP